MNFLGKYSNGWGHLIMSLAAIIFCGVLLIVSQDTTVKGLANTVATLLIGYWFGSGKALFEQKQKAGSNNTQPLQGAGEEA